MAYVARIFNSKPILSSAANMNVTEGVFVTDGVNRHRMLLPLKELVGSMEGPLAAAIARGMPSGMPINVDHDKCRPLGWSVPAGVYLAKDMTRQLGAILLPETNEEKAQLQALIRHFELNWQLDAIEPHAQELERRVEELTSEPVRYWHLEGAGCVGPNLAAIAYPDFFRAGSELVDKDGLIDYAALLERTEQIHPGVFHEKEQDLLVYAHPYFRRSLSRRNSLNGYMLRSFHKVATTQPGVRARLKLDPDLIGLPASGHEAVMELEYWHGPRYDDAIEKIPSGVAEHKNKRGDSDVSGIDRTQIWWKDAETRTDALGAVRSIRTFEVEEMVEDPSPGLRNGEYGCRYAHAEYDLTQRVISHFDGAIRAYSGEAYLERIERRIDRAGKHARYTKLFRFDGALPVRVWKRVLSDFYRGNQLIPEYLGAPEEESLVTQLPTVKPRKKPMLPRLSAYLALAASPMQSPRTISIVADQHLVLDGGTLPVAEIGCGHVAETMRRWICDDEVGTMPGQVQIANLARIVLPGAPGDPTAWQEVSEALAAAIAEDAESGSLAAISIAIGWSIEGASVTLSIAGDALPVAGLLEAATPIVRPDRWPSEWVEAFRDALCAHAPELDAPVDWPGKAVHFRRITIERDGETGVAITLESNEDEDDGAVDPLPERE